jgi:hypothetical protein
MRDAAEKLREAGVDTRTLVIHATAPIFRLRVPANEAVARWHQLVSVRDRTQLHPVLLGTEADVREAQPLMDQMAAADVKPILEAASSIDGARLLAQGVVERDPELDPLDESGVDDPQPAADLSITDRISPLVMVLLPTSDPWKAVAHLCAAGGSGWTTPEHVAVHKHWFETHGAELLSFHVRDGYLELRAGRPPSGRDQALALAREHYAYASWLIDGGHLTLGQLAGSLRHSQFWHLSWP